MREKSRMDLDRQHGLERPRRDCHSKWRAGHSVGSRRVRVINRTEVQVMGQAGGPNNKSRHEQYDDMRGTVI